MTTTTAAPTTGIEWTDATWNPVIGCTPISAGCLNCYAATMANRQQQMPNARDYHPRVVDNIPARPPIRIAEVRSGRAVFTGDVRTLEHRLMAPLTWKKPRKVFVCSMSDLFHASVPFDFIDKVFAIMALCPQHTFQVLTKRPERMAEYLTGIDDQRRRVMNDYANSISIPPDNDYAYNARWPLPNVWLGTSVEDQKAAETRIPHLLKCPAAVRFLSCEPLLEDVDLNLAKTVTYTVPTAFGVPDKRASSVGELIHWVIFGGESGHNARPCDVQWIRRPLQQCIDAGVPPFVKQLGTRPYMHDDDFYATPDAWRKSLVFAGRMKGYEHMNYIGIGLKDRAGGDMAEWPQDLRIRQFPTPAAF